MQPAIINVTKAPVNTMSLDTVVYIGKAQIRRNVGHSTTLLIADSIVDRQLTVAKSSTKTVSESGSIINGIYLQTDYPLKVVIDGGSPIVVKSLLVLQSDITSLSMENESVDYDATVKLVYGYTKNSAPLPA